MYPQGGHLWVFINWALGLKSCGCDVTWLDIAPENIPIEELIKRFHHLKSSLQPFGLHRNLVLEFLSSEDLSRRLHEAAIPSLTDLEPFDLLVDLRYNLPERLFTRFRRKVLINIDPGAYELALDGGVYPAPRHDLLFSIGKSWVQRDPRKWIYTPPCVYLGEWPFTLGSADAPWTTVSHWWVGGDNSKRAAFRDFMTIPSMVNARFELAVNVAHEGEQERIESAGFRVLNPHYVASTPAAFRAFIQNSAGEFSCAKPMYVKLKTAWLSDRTLCYLASGRPCVVQHTGPSHLLPDQGCGLHRFKDLSQAAKAIRTVIADYETESRAARSLAEEFFDARKVCTSLLGRTL